jgi:hypothetical protein
LRPQPAAAAQAGSAAGTTQQRQQQQQPSAVMEQASELAAAAVAASQAAAGAAEVLAAAVDSSNAAAAFTAGVGTSGSAVDVSTAASSPGQFVTAVCVTAESSSVVVPTGGDSSGSPGSSFSEVEAAASSDAGHETLSM